MPAATLIYVDHILTSNTICSICLEPVAQKAVQISCHELLNCAECVGLWMECQLHRRSKASCPRCRKNVDRSNLIAPLGSLEWDDVRDWGLCNYEYDFGDYNDYNENDFSSYFEDMDDSGTGYEQDAPSSQGDGVSEDSSENYDSFSIIHQDDTRSEAETMSDGEDNRSLNGISHKEDVQDSIMEDGRQESPPLLPDINAFQATRHETSARASPPHHEVPRTFPLQFIPHNVLIAPGVTFNSPASPFQICAEYRSAAHAPADEFFFWVHRGTTIKDLVDVWAGEEGEAYFFNGSTWVFEGEELEWFDSVASCGMEPGSRIEIRDCLDSSSL